LVQAERKIGMYRIALASSPFGAYPELLDAIRWTLLIGLGFSGQLGSTTLEIVSIVGIGRR
jgi:hypothetical protein